MEHIYFEAQLCIEITVFKGTHVFDMLIILALQQPKKLNFVCLLGLTFKPGNYFGSFQIGF